MVKNPKFSVPKTLRKTYALSTPRYNLEKGIDGITEIKGYIAGILTVINPDLYTFGKDSKGNAYIQWNTSKGSQGSSFKDDFDRADGSVGNGWTTHKPSGGTNAIKNDEVFMYNPESSYGTSNYSLNVRTNSLGAGTDASPITIHAKVRWEDNAIIQAQGFTGVFFYWDSDADGRTFCGTAVGNNGTTTGLYTALNGTWTGATVDGMLAKKHIYVRCVINTSKIYYYYSFSGTNDDWHAHPSNADDDRSTTTQPSDFIMGHGYASTITTGTYLKNSYMV